MRGGEGKEGRYHSHADRTETRRDGKEEKEEIVVEKNEETCVTGEERRPATGRSGWREWMQQDQHTQPLFSWDITFTYINLPADLPHHF